MTPEERQAWLEERRTGIGGSDAAAACGMSPWKTRLELWLDKRGELTTTETQQMRFGTLLEPIIRQEYADRTGRTVVVPGILRHPRTAFAIATLDGIADDERVLECKTARTSEGWGEPGTDEIPTVYLFQVQHCMYVAQMPVADVAVLIGGSDFRLYEVPADQELQGMIVEAESEFWRHVLDGIPPEPANPEDVKRRWRVSSGRQVQAADEILTTVAALREAKRQAKLIADDIESFTCVLQQFMGDAAELTHDGRTLATWKNVRGSPRFDAERFKAEQTDVWKQYLSEPEPQRRFLLKSTTE